ncbi:alpha-tocopherol transfer protein-like isoform X4 [Hyalella azteca]|uniref:Alpha-tocopherol transfer protein-like isoform X4 n=1 Tax=Hyalella azteca TaxID=294128 RepID=A0A8B7PR02_HYAAZ|nr:alpha-tocopherol transfer protein-like isoform X4 [Hyalella azteca]
MPEKYEKYVCTLSPELQQQAKDELNEDPARRQEDIDAIRKWLKKQPHINARMDDWNILRFLRGCKFSLERTKEKMDMFYTCKTAVPEWFANRDPDEPKMRELLQMGVFLPLPTPHPNGTILILGRMGAYDAHKNSMDDVTKAALLILDIMSDECEQMSIAGLAEIIDCSGMTGAHVLQMTPALAKKSLVLMQDGYPMRPKALHYINTPAAFDTVFNIFKSFMKEKMKKRIHIHGSDLSSLHKHIPPSLLPKEYGGTNGTVEDITRHWLKRVEARKQWLKEDEQYKVDESKRPGKPKTSSDLFGIEGSFRQLNVD